MVIAKIVPVFALSRPVKRTEAFVVGNRTHIKNGRAVNYNSVLLTCRHAFLANIPSLS